MSHKTLEISNFSGRMSLIVRREKRLLLAVVEGSTEPEKLKL
jgi:hypothetical protein